MRCIEDANIRMRQETPYQFSKVTPVVGTIFRKGIGPLTAFTRSMVVVGFERNEYYAHMVGG